MGEWEGLPEYINEMVKAAIADNNKASKGHCATLGGCNAASKPEGTWEVLATNDVS